MDINQYSYRELQIKLKVFRENGYVVPPLNSTKTVLFEAYCNIVSILDNEILESQEYNALVERTAFNLFGDLLIQTVSVQLNNLLYAIAEEFISVVQNQINKQYDRARIHLIVLLSLIEELSENYHLSYYQIVKENVQNLSLKQLACTVGVSL